MSGGMSDDLPRTLRREREARERSQSGLDRNGPRSQGGGYAAPSMSDTTAFVPELARGEGDFMHGTTVTDIRIPFFRMMAFCFKLVFAAIPALILLGIFLWTAGHLLMTYAPWLVKVQILIRVPN